VDVQLIAATHQNLPELVREKRFRSDLYFRISTIPLHVPALRERTEDIPLLARRFLGTFASDLGRRGLGLSPAAERALCSYSWPGNMRELRNVIERAVLLCPNDLLEPGDLRFDGPASAPAADVAPASVLPDACLTLDEVERLHIEHTLRDLGGRVAEASQRLGIPRSTLYQKIKKYRLSVPRSS
jgi:DNA-binding NtrC family response regulator